MEEQSTNETPEQAPQKGNAMIWVAVVAVVVVLGIIYFSRGDNQTKTPASSNTPVPSTNEMSVKSFDISGKPFEYSIKEIRVKKGDKVKINLTSTLGMHDWVVDEFNAKTKVVKVGESDSIEFTVDKTGTFEYYCSVPTHRQQGMIGKLIVE